MRAAATLVAAPVLALFVYGALVLPERRWGYVIMLVQSLAALGMPIIGGTSHWMGPVIGALILGTLQQVVTVTVSSELNVLVVGLLLVFLVVAAPDGVLGLVKKWKQSSK